MTMNWTQQITTIRDWQLASGNTGAPPKSFDARLAHWARWAARQAVIDPALASELEDLGIEISREKESPRPREATAHQRGRRARDSGWGMATSCSSKGTEARWAHAHE